MSEQQRAGTGQISASYEEAAADGGRRYPTCTTLTDLVFMLNDGAFNQNAADKLGEFAANMEQLGIDTAKKVKGKITLTIEVEREADGGVYFFPPTLVTKLPPERNSRTIGWVTAENHFTPNQPNQGNLFGTVRDVSAPREVRGI